MYSPAKHQYSHTTRMVRPARSIGLRSSLMRVAPSYLRVHRGLSPACKPLLRQEKRGSVPSRLGRRAPDSSYQMVVEFVSCSLRPTEMRGAEPRLQTVPMRRSARLQVGLCSRRGTSVPNRTSDRGRMWNWSRRVVLKEIRKFLPLPISAAEADADGVCLSGDRWRLRVNTNWSVSEGEMTVMSPSLSKDFATACGLRDLVGDEFVQVGVQSRQVGLDLVLTTRSGLVFEILSDYPYGEWLLTLWSPGDERQTPIFDLEGPYHLSSG